MTPKWSLPLLVLAACGTPKDGPPTATITSPSSGTSLPAGEPLVLAGTVSDAEDAPADLSARWLVDGAEVCAASPPAADGTTTCTISPTAAAAAVIGLEVVDVAGNTGSATVTVSFTDAAPANASPTCTITAPADGGWGAVGETVAFGGLVGDPDGSAAALTVTWSSDHDGPLATVTPAANGAVELVTDALSDATHHVTLRAADPGGAVCTATVAWTVDAPPTLTLLEPAPGTVIVAGDTLGFAATVADPDHPAGELVVRWESSLDGVLQEEPADDAGNASLYTAALSPGEHWLTVTVTDPLGLSATASSSFLVDQPPTAPGVAIEPRDPDTTDDLTVVLDPPAADPDGDDVSYRYTWLRDGVISTASTTATLPASATTAGERWTVEVRATDGFADSEAATATVSIQAGQVSIPGVTLSPDPVDTDDVLTATATVVDPDGGAVSSAYDWYVDGALVQSGAAATLDGARFFDRDDSVYVVVTADNGASTATATSSTVVVANAAPGAPGLTLTPDPPSEGDDLVCAVSTPSADADGDSVTYTFAWAVDGVAYTGATDDADQSTVPGADVVDGEEWTCTVTPDDGADVGAVASVSAGACASLYFDGNDYVEVPEASDFPSGNAPRTATVWAWATGYSTVNLFTFGSGNVRNSRWSVLLESSSSMKLVGQNNDYWFTYGGLSRWTHIAMVYDGSYLYYYEDGVLTDSERVTSAFATSNAYALIIGSDSRDRNDEFYRGYLADLRVWNRALSAAEVADDMATSTADPTDLVGQWAMREGSGSTVSDHSGNGHDGRITGATWSTECP